MSVDWKKTLGAIAPTIATALGGPLAGTAVKFLSSELLGVEHADETELQKAVEHATPEALERIKQIDQDFKLKMEKLGVDVFKIEAKDKASARKYHKESSVPASLSAALTFIIGVLLYALFYIEPPAGAREPLLIVLGMVVKEWSNAMHYWFGTTRSSHDKTKLMSLK